MLSFLDYLAEEYIDYSAYNLKEKYQLFNHRCFSSQLPDVPITWFDSRTSSGITNADYSKTTRKLKPGSIDIKISSRFKNTEEELDSTLLHEMIHVWFYSKDNFTEHHGFEFRRKAREIEHITGFPIPVTDSLDDKELRDEEVGKEVGVILIHKKDNTYVGSLFPIKTFKVGYTYLLKYAQNRSRDTHESIWLIQLVTPLARKFPLARKVGYESRYHMNSNEATSLLKGSILHQF